jgi:hypothetical protein
MNSLSLEFIFAAAALITTEISAGAPPKRGSSGSASKENETGVFQCHHAPRLNCTGTIRFSSQSGARRRAARAAALLQLAKTVENHRHNICRKLNI